jgi:AcrR family transcriptional regulator
MPRQRAKKPAYHHGDLRRALIDAALVWVAREGTGAVSLRELAETVGVSHAAPYRHFRNKELLFTAVAGEGFKMLRDAMVAERDRAGKNPRARLLATGVAYVRFAVAHPGHFKVMFSHVAKPPAEAPGTGLEGADAFGVLLEAVVAAQAARELRKGDATKQALFAWSGVHGLSSLIIEHCLAPLGLTGAPETQARWLVEMLVDGLGARRK